MCHGDIGLKYNLRETEARVAALARAQDEDRQVAPAAPGWLARLFGALAGWMRKEARA